MTPKMTGTRSKVYLPATGAGRATGLLASDELLFESCERRLVLSAQLLFDVLGDQALELHGDALPGNSIPLQSHLQEAHVATGLDTVREQFGLTGTGQTVAVIDSGIAWDHVALGQGYGPGYRVVGGWDFTEENDAQPYDDAPAGFHGTHVSGIIGSDDPLHPGVAPDVDLVALRVFNDSGQGQLSWVENALRWVHEHRNSFENPITAVNLSLGTQWNGESNPEWATLEEELGQLFQDGIVVTASAGNSFQDYQSTGLSYPASSSYVLPVASVDDDGQLSDFSQRSGRVLAAPGSNVVSTIPDHVLGRDGRVDDFSPASGTSMAAPYVAGASVLVRQAMEMTGWESINATTISDHLRSTADTVFDAITGLNYDSLNLQRAIESLLPSDMVGDSVATASFLDPTSGGFETWINHLQDVDVYRFTADASGTLTLDASSEWVETLQWSVHSAGQEIGQGQWDPATVDLIAGQTYELHVSAAGSIGPLAMDWAFEEAVAGGESGGQLPTGEVTDLGAIQYYHGSLEAAGYTVTAAQDGVFTVQWTNADAPSGALWMKDGSGQTVSSDTWANGTIRLDVEVRSGDRLEVWLPGSHSDQGELAMANVLARSGTSATVTGTLAGDDVSLNLRDGVRIGFGAVDYAFASGQITQLHLDGYGNNDHLDLVGSSASDKVELRPTGSTLENGNLQVVVDSIEEITFQGGDGADRVYIYDSDTDDTLIAHPGRAELAGVGYRFEVQEVDRIFMHATGGGQDYAYLYDSSGDDRLSVRPQFTSISGDGFFNYVRGFERVYAYANAGGTDTANLYDSEGDDRFTTSGVSASIVGPGFSSFTRSFEHVNAYADAGGSNLATLYGTDGQTRWQQGSDFVSFRENAWDREARGFDQVETYRAGQLFSVDSLSIGGHTPPSPDLVATNALATDDVSVAGPYLPPVTIASAAGEGLLGGERGLEGIDPEPSVLADGDHEADLRPEGETQLLQTALSIRELLADHLYLPEERLLADPQLEQDVLDEAFRQFDELF